MIKKLGLILLVIIILAAAAGFLVWSYCQSANKSMAYNELVKPQNQLTLDDFLESSNEMGIVRTEVYYLPFSAVAMTIPFEEDILSEGYLIVASENILALHHQYIANSLSDFSSEEKKESPTNFRYCCVMYDGNSKSNKAIRFSIALSSLETIVINGVPYKTTPEVVDAFLKLLPAVDYEKAMKWVEED